MKWLVHNYGEQGSGWEVEVEAETRKEAIQKAPYDWQDPNRTYYGAVQKTLSQPCNPCGDNNHQMCHNNPLRPCTCSFCRGLEEAAKMPPIYHGAARFEDSYIDRDGKFHLLYWGHEE